MAKRPVCAVVGVGPGNGAAFARRFANDGYAVALLARSADTSSALAKELTGSRAYACDVGDAASVQRAFDGIRSDLGDPEVVIYNAGSGTFGTFDDTCCTCRQTPRPNVNAATVPMELARMSETDAFGMSSAWVNVAPASRLLNSP